MKFEQQKTKNFEFQDKKRCSNYFFASKMLKDEKPFSENFRPSFKFCRTHLFTFPSTIPQLSLSKIAAAVRIKFKKNINENQCEIELTLFL